MSRRSRWRPLLSTSALVLAVGLGDGVAHARAQPGDRGADEVPEAPAEPASSGALEPASSGAPAPASSGAPAPASSGAPASTSSGASEDPFGDVTGEARDEEPLPVSNQRFAGRRAWGLGSMILAAGYQGFALPGEGALGLLALQLPTFDMAFFLRSRHAIEVSVPVVNIALTPLFGALIGVPLFVWRTDVFYNFNVGERRTRFVAGPGLGFSVGGASGAFQLGLRIPAELGLEVLSTSKGVSFRMLLRPFFEVYALTGSQVESTGAVYGGGALLGLGVMGYKVRR